MLDYFLFNHRVAVLVVDIDVEAAGIIAFFRLVMWRKSIHLWLVVMLTLAKKLKMVRLFHQ